MRIVVTFYLGQNEDDSPEIASQIAEKVLQRGRGKGQYIYMILVKEKYMKSSAYFCRSFLLVTKNRRHMNGCSAFLDMRRYKNWALKIGV